MRKRNHKKLVHLGLFFAGLFGIGIGVLVLQNNTFIPPVAYAQTANSMYFSQTSLSVAPKATLNLKANVGTNLVNFVSASVKIDITKVKVDSALAISYPLVVNRTLFLAVPQTDTAHINCNPSSGDAACTNGLIRFALSKCPQAAVTTQTQYLEGCFGISNAARTGTFDIVQIPIASVNDTLTTTSTITYDTVGNELVKDGTNPPQDLSFTTVGASLTIPLRGDANMDRYVTSSDLIPWRTNYGQTLTSGAISGDFNGDTFVTAGDLLIWRANYGRGG